MQSDTVLLLGNYRPTLTLARQLAPQGYRVAVTRGGGEGGAEFSRHVSECWTHPSADDPVAFSSALAAHLRSRPDINIVFPVWEECVLAVARYRDQLPADRIYATPAPDTVLTCLDKTNMLLASKNADVPCAPFSIVSSYPALTEAIEKIGFPLVIRPVSTAQPLFGRKALILSSKADAFEQLAKWPQAHDQLIVQTYVEGPRLNVYFAAEQGRVIRLLSADILRTNERDGTGLAVEGRTIETDPPVQSFVERLAKSLNYHGVGCVQFLRDPSRGPLFLELNPRIAGNHAIAEASGLELSRLSIDLARTGGPRETLKVAPGGQRYVWTYADLGGVKTALKKRQIGVVKAAVEAARALAMGLSSRIHMTWDWRDPLPTIAIFSRKLGVPLPRRWAAQTQ